MEKVGGGLCFAVDLQRLMIMMMMIIMNGKDDVEIDYIDIPWKQIRDIS